LEKGGGGKSVAGKFDFVVDEEYERRVAREYNLLDGDQRELNIAGAYTPVKGIYALGWQGWKDQPNADFVEALIDWHNGFLRDHASDPFYPEFSPLIYKGEIELEDLKRYHKRLMVSTSEVFMFEGLAHARAHLIGAKEVRDLIARHIFEETGHNEMFADFMVGVYKMDRVKEVYPLTDPTNFDRPLFDWYKAVIARNAKGHFVEVAAASMLMERWIPKAYKKISEGLRKHYQIPNQHLTFMDIHTYIDIYHERFGAYILAKYAGTKELQDAAENAFKSSVEGLYNNTKLAYDLLPVHKK
jgi:hypothetical protein